MASDEMDIQAEEIVHCSQPKKQKMGGRISGCGESAVREHYTKCAGENKCKYCTYSTTDNRPGNLAAHLKTKHKDAFAKYEEKTAARKIPKLPSTITPSSALSASSSTSVVQPKLSQFIGQKPVKYYDEDSDRYKSLLNALTLLFASNSLPYLLVESTELEYFVKLLDPKFKLPKRKNIARETGGLHSKLKSILQTEIKKADKLCLILDIWSRRGLSESYLGMLVRYFDRNSLSTKQALISLAKMEGSHTGDNIKETLKWVLRDWDISDSDISYYVTDSGSNIIKALKECVIVFAPAVREEEENKKDDDDEFSTEEGDRNMDAEETEEDMVEIEVEKFNKLEQEHDVMFGYTKRIPCIAHKLMCVVRNIFDGSKKLKPIIQSVTKLVKAFTQSGVNKELLLQYNNKLGLLSPSNTRWVYTYYVLNRLLVSKEAVEKVVKDQKLKVALTSVQWDQIENIRDLLRLFADVVNDLEGDKYPTINQVIPAIKNLIHKLKDNPNEVYGRSEIDVVRRELKKEIEIKFAFILDHSQADFQPAHMIATFFDPLYIKGLKIEQRDVCIKIIIRDILSSMPRSIVQEANFQSTSSASTAEKKYAGFFEETEESTSSSSTQYDQSKMLQIKLEAYIQEALSFQQSSSNTSQDKPFVDPTTFWAGKISTFGEIANYALNILVVPASSAGIERVFSLASIVQGGRRFRLSADSTEKELMIKVNRDFLI